MTDQDPPPPEAPGCGCINLLVIVDMVALGIVGYRIGAHWGMALAIVGALLGAVLALPATGLLVLLLAGIAFVFEAIASRKG